MADEQTPTMYPQQEPAAQGSQSSPWFTQQGANDGAGLSTTADDGITNQQLNRIANDMGDQSAAVVTALEAIATAINAKPSA